jgi:hypothetical protein
MRKLLFLTCAVGLFSIAAIAQNKASYSGMWTLDASKSKLDERMRVDSITLTVAQTDKEIKVETAIKRLPPNDAAPPAGAPAGAPGGAPGRGMGRGGFGDGTTVYSLDGKEVKGEVDGPMGKMPVIYKGSQEADGSLKLSSSRSFSGPNGEVKITTNETWKLSSDGKTLTVDREQSNPRGTTTSTLVFAKK